MLRIGKSNPIQHALRMHFCTAVRAEEPVRAARFKKLAGEEKEVKDKPLSRFTGNDETQQRLKPQGRRVSRFKTGPRTLIQEANTKPVVNKPKSKKLGHFRDLLKDTPAVSDRFGGLTQMKMKHKPMTLTERLSQAQEKPRLASLSPSSPVLLQSRDVFGYEAKRRKMKQIKRKQKKPEKPQVQRKVEIPPEITVAELANNMAVKIRDVRKILRSLGEAKVRDDTILQADTAELVVSCTDMSYVLLPPDFIDIEPTVPPADMSSFPKRAPIVSVMGHVDHGKTTLLDSLRQTDVAAKEAGGITQSIGAFNVDMGSTDVEEGFRHITFIDTPGHEAFSAMRENGTEVTDIIVVVVAAEDGLQPQTVEVVKLAREHNVPIVVAITKCDRMVESQDEIVTRISYQLAEHGVVTEKLDGDTQVVCVSGVTKEGIPELKQAIALQAEIMDLRADVSASGEAVILDSVMSKGVGPQLDVIVKWGTLRVGDIVIAGSEYGKIKSIMNQRGKKIKEALPSMPVRVMGLKGLPPAGETVLPVKTEAQARSVVEERSEIEKWAQAVMAKGTDCNKRPHFRARSVRQKKILFRQRMLNEEKENQRLAALKPGDEGYVANVVPVVFKTNSNGVISAIENLTTALPCDEVKLKTIRAAVGPVTENDVNLAAASKASIFCFDTRHPASINKLAKQLNVKIYQHKVVYSLLDGVRELLESQLEGIVEEKVLGTAHVLESFPVTTRGNRNVHVAGCRVMSGLMKLDASYRVFRDGKLLSQVNQVESMRHFKDKVTEVKKGQECGIQLSGFDEFQAGDVLEAFVVHNIKRSL